jgi:hypothetical protein
MGLFSKKPPPEVQADSDEELAIALRRMVQQAAELRLALYNRGWAVCVFIGSDGTSTVDVERRIKL